MSRLRKLAQGQRCTVRLPGCDGGGETTVLAHYGGTRFGGGRGIKAHDIAGADACHSCHQIVDGQKPAPSWMSKDEVRHAHAEAVIETVIRRLEDGEIQLR